MGLTLEEANRVLRGTLAKAQELNVASREVSPIDFIPSRF